MPYPNDIKIEEIEFEDPDTSEIDAAEAKVAKLREVVKCCFELNKVFEQSIYYFLTPLDNYILGNFFLWVSREERENAINMFGDIFNGEFTGMDEIGILNEAIDDMVHEYLKRARGE